MEVRLQILAAPKTISSFSSGFIGSHHSLSPEDGQNFREASVQDFALLLVLTPHLLLLGEQRIPNCSSC